MLTRHGATSVQALVATSDHSIWCKRWRVVTSLDNTL